MSHSPAPDLDGPSEKKSQAAKGIHEAQPYYSHPHIPRPSLERGYDPVGFNSQT